MKYYQIVPTTALAIVAFFPSSLMAEGWDDWEFTVGVGGIYGPEAEGSKDSKIGPAFNLEARWRDKVSIGFGGISWDFLQSENYTLTTSLGYDGGRDASEHANYRGLGDIGGGAVLGFGASTEFGPVSAGVDINKYFGGSEGLTAEFGVETHIPLAVLFGGRELDFGSENEPSMKEIGPVLFAGLSTTWADKDYNGSYYGVNAAQSAASGLNTYNAAAGFNDVSLQIGVMFPITEKLAINTFVEQTRYIGDAGDSPIIREKDQTSVGVLVNFNF